MHDLPYHRVGTQPRTARTMLELTLLTALAVAGCGSDELSCEETLTCPHEQAGSAGESSLARGGGGRGTGEAGASGSVGRSGDESGSYDQAGAGGKTEAKSDAGADSDADAMGGARSTRDTGEAGEAGDPDEAREADAQGGADGQDDTNRAGGPANTSAAGDGGASGASRATSAPPECESDDDCDDDIACNGQEACTDGQCEPGNAVECDNPDPEHCAAACVETDSGADCTMAALDQDEDGVGTELCEAAPGEDCDDADPTTYAGAEELCDGIDNDCDAKVDLDDGLELAGTTTTIAQAMEMDVEWSPVSESFLLVIERRGPAETGTDEDLATATLSTTGAFSEEATLLDDEANFAYQAPRIAWGDGEFGIAYTQKQCGSSGGQASCNNTSGFIRVDADGGVVSVVPLDRVKNRPGDIVYRTSGDWLVPYARSGALEIDAWFANDAWTQGPIIPQDSAVPRMAVRGEQSAVIWQEAAWSDVGPDLGGVGPIVWAVISADLESVVTQELASDGFRPGITALPEGYGMAWLTNGGLAYEARDSDANRLCGPTHVVFGDSEVDWRDSVAVAYTTSGVLVVAADPVGGIVELFRFDEACHLLGRIPLGDTFTQPGWPNIAVGGGHVAVVWTERLATNEYKGYARVFSEALCE